MPSRSPAHRDPLQLISHPQNISGRGLVQGQNQNLGTVRETFDQTGQGRLGAPQTLQEAGLVGEGVDDQRPFLGSGLVGERPVQSRDSERSRGVARLRPVSGLRAGFYTVVMERSPERPVRALVQFDSVPRCPRFCQTSCHNDEEQEQRRRR